MDLAHARSGGDAPPRRPRPLRRRADQQRVLAQRVLLAEPLERRAEPRRQRRERAAGLKVAAAPQSRHGAPDAHAVDAVGGQVPEQHWCSAAHLSGF